MEVSSRDPRDVRVVLRDGQVVPVATAIRDVRLDGTREYSVVLTQQRRHVIHVLVGFLPRRSVLLGRRSLEGQCLSSSKITGRRVRYSVAVGMMHLEWVDVSRVQEITV